MPNDSRRLLIRAVLLSLLAHALLLVGVVNLWPTLLATSGSGSRALLRGQIARLTPATGTGTSVPRETVVPVAASGEKRSVVLRPSADGTRPLAQRGGAAPAPRMTPVTTEQSAVAQSALRGEATEGLDAEDVRQYRFSLALAARRFKPGNRLGAEGPRPGTVEVAVSGRRGQPFAQVVLYHSSGVDSLDGDALIMMKQAAGIVTLPDGMRGHDFRIIIQLVFGRGDDAGR